MERKKRRSSFKEGDIVKVAINNTEHTYMRIVVNRLCAFYDFKTVQDVHDLNEIVSKPVLFIIIVHNEYLKEGEWIKVGNLPLEEYLKMEPNFFIKHIRPRGMPHSFTIFINGDDIPATWEECKDLEPSAVYTAPNVRERLHDFYYGDQDRILNEYLSYR